MKRKALTIALVTATALGLTAIVQAGPGFGHGFGMGSGPAMHGQMGPGMHGFGGMGHGFGGMGHGFASGEYVDGTLAFLKTEIGITDDQEKAWSKFADAIRGQAESRKAHREAMWNSREAMWSANAVERTERHIANMEFRAKQAKAHLNALKELYGELTEEQRARADTLVPGGHHGPRFGRGKGYGPGMQRGGPPA